MSCALTKPLKPLTDAERLRALEREVRELRLALDRAYVLLGQLSEALTQGASAQQNLTQAMSALQWQFEHSRRLTAFGAVAGVH